MAKTSHGICLKVSYVQIADEKLPIAVVWDGFSLKLNHWKKKSH